MTPKWQCMNCRTYQDILEDDDPSKVLCMVCKVAGKLAPVVYVPKPHGQPATK